ncbi:hypothetical protein [Streptomyces sp. ISL-1]|uniref:hypothetical protein n=1 Tax=Streptomyces sp. ISL-1 TaxID=2817657 RepID=UPI00203610AB|nr:hypothetical protein [Streptomyces sp. ISL-1]
MSHFRRRYGASPLHLLLVLCSFALALYAGVRLLKGDAWGVAIWFVGAALLHDLVLLPLYSVTDRVMQYVLRPSGGPSTRTPLMSVNYLRVPLFVSALLLLVWWPLILRQVSHFTVATALSADVFLGRWLVITAILFAASALCLLLRARAATRPARRAARAQRAGRKAAK